MAARRIGALLRETAREPEEGTPKAARLNKQTMAEMTTGQGSKVAYMLARGFTPQQYRLFNRWWSALEGENLNVLEPDTVFQEFSRMFSPFQESHLIELAEVIRHDGRSLELAHLLLNVRKKD